MAVFSFCFQFSVQFLNSMMQFIDVMFGSIIVTKVQTQGPRSIVA